MSGLIFQLRRLALAVLMTASLAHVEMAAANPHNHASCTLIPKSGLRLPENRGVTSGGMSQMQYRQLLRAANQVYGPIFRRYGLQLVTRDLWSSPEVNAVAYMGRETLEQQQKLGIPWEEVDKSVRRVDMYGGLARHPLMTTDAYLMVMCHEIGHHIGGLPIKPGAAGMSSEGQSDYFAASKCMRLILERADNLGLMSRLPVDGTVRRKCLAAHRDSSEAALCARVSMAGHALANVLSSLGRGPKVDFNTPDRNVVSTTDYTHPDAQCRLDTYFAGALCRVPATVSFSYQNALHGACVPERATNSAGIRPACWFNPTFYSRPELLIPRNRVLTNRF